MDHTYQYKDGSYLPNSQQPNTIGKYLPHKSTRYKNIIIGKNGIAKTPLIKGSKVKLIDSEKQLPELYSERENCCGCSACALICTVIAINMESDEEGFDYPVVDASKCIRCYKCLNVCPIKAKLANR